MNQEKYAGLFERYAQHTNGKQIIGTRLAKLADTFHKARILDVGAGNGSISRMLLPHADYLHSIEPNPQFTAALTSLASDGYGFSITSVQDFDGVGTPYDLIILSYVLESIEPDEWNRILRKLYGLLSNHGRIIGVTYLDGCGWDSFAAIAASLSGSKRQAGLGYVTKKAREAGFNLSVLEIVDTEIWGKTLQNLYYNLEFYFVKRMEVYEGKQQQLKSELSKLTVEKNDRTILSVQEVIFELWPLRLQ
ncbi:class I SAM-dependent methyltransferase [Candidatus Parcubacteria bacterium]|nr:class I SAM-dependent methyltransferase [Candidatus Parcubacteria bacterium]